MMKSVGTFIEIGALLFCLLVLSAVGIFIVGLFLGTEPLNYGKATFLALIGAFAVKLGLEPAKALFRLVQPSPSGRQPKGAKQDFAEDGLMVAKLVKLSWWPVLVLSGVIGGVTLLFCWLFIASNGDLRSAAATCIFGLSTIVFIVSRYRLLRGAVSKEGVYSPNLGRQMTKYFGGVAFIVWLFATIVLVISALLV